MKKNTIRDAPFSKIFSIRDALFSKKSAKRDTPIKRIEGIKIEKNKPFPTKVVLMKGIL